MAISMFTTTLSKENGESAYGFVMSSKLYLVGADATIDQNAYSFKEAEARVIVYAIRALCWIGALQKSMSLPGGP